MGAALTWYATTSSTNDRAMEAATSGAAHGTVVVADTQTSGRGRLGRVWQSPAGAGLYVSAIVMAPGGVVPLLPLAAGVALAEGVRAGAGLDVQLKWPNDIWVDGRKLGGILAEAVSVQAEPSTVVLGFGLNLDAAALPPEVAGLATSLEIELGRRADRGVLLAECLAALERSVNALRDGRAGEVLAAWRRLAAPLMGRRVEWDSLEGVREGRAAGIGDDGALLVDTPTEVVQLRAGEVRWR